MKLTDEQNLALKKNKWNKVGKKNSDCVWIELYADEMIPIVWENICELTGHHKDNDTVKILLIGVA